MNDTEKPYVGTPEVAKHFQVSVTTIRNWIKSGHIPPDTYIKIGEVYRFRLGEVDTALTKNAAKGQSKASKSETNGE